MTAAVRPATTASRRWLTVLLVVLGSLLPTVPASAAPTDAWASKSGGPGNAMVNAGEKTITAATAARVAEAWRTTSANTGGTEPPAVVGDVVYHLHDPVSEDDAKTLVAASARTGRTLWQVELSRGVNRYLTGDGVTVSGSLVLIPFNKPFNSVGITAVDRYRRTVAWTSTVPGDTGAYHSWSGHEVHSDGTRAYLVSNYTLAAYRLSDGKLLWTTRLESNLHVGVAVGNGRVFVGYDGQTPGITALDPATGRELWSGPGAGTPVVAGGRVFSTRYGTVYAMSAAGCGTSTCPALWSKRLPALHPAYVLLGAADSRNLFVSYQQSVPGDPTGDYAGVLTRLSAATGAQQWSRTLGHQFSPAVRGGDVVWTVNLYMGADNRPHARIMGFAATGTRTASLRNIATDSTGSPQTLAVGGGTLLGKTHIPDQLVGYRVAGT